MVRITFAIGGNNGWLVIVLVRAGSSIGIAGFDINERLLT